MFVLFRPKTRSNKASLSNIIHVLAKSIHPQCSFIPKDQSIVSPISTTSKCSLNAVDSKIYEGNTISLSSVNSSSIGVSNKENDRGGTFPSNSTSSSNSNDIPQMYRLQRRRPAESSSSSASSNAYAKKHQAHMFSATARHRAIRKLRFHELKQNKFNVKAAPPPPSSSLLSNYGEQETLTLRSLTQQQIRGSIMAHMSATAKYRRSRMKLPSSSSTTTSAIKNYNIPNPSSITILDERELEESYENLRASVASLDSTNPKTANKASMEDQEMKVANVGLLSRVYTVLFGMKTK